MPLQYLFDEHVPRALAEALRRWDPELVVWSIGEPGVPPRGTADPDILIWCETHGFVLVTDNRKSMPGHLAAHVGAGRHVLGIFILSHKLGMGDTVAELWVAAYASLEGEYRDQIRHLPLA